jgi:hypothetical protein
MNIDEIIRRLQHCLSKLYSDDYDLIERHNYEVTISAKIAQYLFLEFKEYDVDCEYNKHLDDDKHSSELNKNIRPDIVIHQRGTDDNNLVCIEIKKFKNNSDRSIDINKVRTLSKLDGEYHYKLGVFLDLAPVYNEMIVLYFINGNQIN